ncbi:PLP-dependent aminotransferase family protein [Chitinimonas arctica]|uniref:Putative 8-amino-7-oxononanoate synthase n=1 Tax=Chitinimonas arctica TaxID=2594795 RepID=A0A516SGA5_9NEIS|nr:PLP-dependent aminotransferase family protein [Chitinimonas arctica]QDQ27193.1 PLP-dependent aminotransferase family protein [Chitinimonas arctica]
MPAPTLYSQLANHYLHAIEAGTLRCGDRMPSVRTLMERHTVSLSTALQACRHLESRGVLEARPRSGYFVRPRQQAALAPMKEPGAALPDPAQYVGIHQRVSAIIAKSQQSPVAINLAGACGAPELYPTEALQTAMIRALRGNPGLLGRPGPPTPNGDPGFRAAIAKNALWARVTLSADEIIVTHGCIEALNLALRAVTQPGDVVAVESPTFFGLLQILESLGLRALEIPSSPQTGISLEALELAAQSYNDIKAVVVVPNLQNPLGSVMPDRHKEDLVHWCEAQRIPLIEDDTYSALGDADTPLSALKAWDRTGNVIHCASLHKTLAPGMRLGWISAGKWHARVEMLKYAQSRSNESLPQIAVAEFMASGAYERHLRRLRTSLRRQREQVSAAIASYFPAGTRLSQPPGGLALWVEMPGKRSSESLFHAALQAGIRIAPGLMFSNSKRFDHYLRISCGSLYSRELEQGIRKLAGLVEALPHTD